MLKRTPKDLLAQADPEKDCVPPPVPEEDEEEHEAEWQAVSAQGTAGVEWPWSARPRIGGRAGLAQIEKIALGVESLVNRLIGADAETQRVAPATQHAASLLNPLYHTGTIAVFLLIVVAVTGLYLTVFYIAPGMGTNVAYESVSAIDRHLLWIGRIVRGVHRYASGAAAVATLFHAIRTLFQDRFRGARWLAWLTGMLLLAAMWFEGLTGYWLVWDQRAQLILETVIRAMTTFPSVGIPFALNFLTNQSTDQTWLLFLLLLFAHIALFTVIGLFYWFHVLRLSRAKFLPPRYFMIALGAILVVASVIVPAASALKADLGRLPGSLTIDPFFLFYLPATLRVNPAFFWSATSIAFGLVTAIPWVFRGKQPGKVVIDKNICTGCTKCAEDCPYNAIAMVPRTDGTLRAHKLIAMENPSLCVSCGICVGSCDGMAVSLTDLPATSYYQSVLARVRTARSAAGVPVKVVFTCERHGAHGAAKWRVTGGEWRDARHASLVTFTLPCVGVLHPNVVGQTLDAGAAEVLVVGCPGDDCAQREGNLWIDARLNRTRLPRLKKQYVGAAIRTALVPPNEFARALNPQPLISDRNAQQQEVFTLKPAHFIRGGILLALFLAFQVAITDVNYQPYSPSESLLQLGIRNDGQLRDQTKVLTGPELAQLSHDEQVKYLEEQQAEGRFPTRLRLEVDGKVVLDNSYRALGFRQEGSSFAYEKFLLPSGQHTVRLSADDAGGDLKPVIDQTTHFAPGQIHAITFDQVTKTFNLK